MILSAQAVPSSGLLPCIAALPSGWTVGGANITSGRSVFWLNSDQAGPRAVTVALAATCGTSGAVRIPSDQAGAERFERPLSLQPRFTLTRMYTFAGGCVTYQFSFVPGAAPLLAIPLDTAIAFEPRADLVRTSGGPRAWRSAAGGPSALGRRHPAGQLCPLPAMARRLSVGYWNGCWKVGWGAAR